MEIADWLEQSCGPDMTLGSSPGLDITMDLGFLTTFASSDLPLSIRHESFCLYLSAILHHIFAYHNDTQLLGIERHGAGRGLFYPPRANSPRQVCGYATRS